MDPPYRASTRAERHTMTENRDTGTSPLPIDIMRIMELIPHRFPFLMVDRIVELTPDEKAVGIKNVSINEPFFQGHFPRDAVMPVLDEFTKHCLLNGLDEISLTLEHAPEIGEFETHRPAFKPVVSGP